MAAGPWRATRLRASGVDRFEAPGFLRPCSVLAAILLLSVSPFAVGAPLYWEGTTDGSFGVNTNWNTQADWTGSKPAAAPGAGDTAVVNPGYPGSNPDWAGDIYSNLTLNTGASVSFGVATVDAVLSTTTPDVNWTLNSGSILNTNGRLEAALDGVGAGSFTLNTAGTISGNFKFDYVVANLAVHFNMTGGTVNFGKSSRFGNASTNGNTFSISDGSFSGVSDSIEFLGGQTGTLSGGSMDVDSTSFSAVGDTQSWTISGGSHDLGAVTLATDASSDLRFTLQDTGMLTMASLTGDSDGNYAWDFLSGWTGSLTITGNTTLDDYWTSLEGANGFLELNSVSIDKATFDSNFLIDGSNALVLVPEPGTMMLLASGFAVALVVFALRRRPLSRVRRPSSSRCAGLRI